MEVKARNIYAHTPAGEIYPPFISISEVKRSDEPGIKYSIIVRSGATDEGYPGNLGMITISKEEAQILFKALADNL